MLSTLKSTLLFSVLEFCTEYHYSDKPEHVPIGKGQLKTILRKHATQYRPSIKPANWEAIFTEVREPFDAPCKGGSRKRVQRCHDSHASSDAVDAEDTIRILNPDGCTPDDTNAPDDNDGIRGC